jgi:hypothetical protein
LVFVSAAKEAGAEMQGNLRQMSFRQAWAEALGTSSTAERATCPVASATHELQSLPQAPSGAQGAASAHTTPCRALRMMHCRGSCQWDCCRIGPGLR